MTIPTHGAELALSIVDPRLEFERRFPQHSGPVGRLSRSPRRAGARPIADGELSRRATDAGRNI
ncbi:hypothetical protein [Nannocystis bainbridge]|uniref:Uncharacterized protein n=1 Tax=Nannocystis bainbridge TaxID=2995303 RepID=A0ABT5DU44_9BACT|nr:hypothetical protein [Nannocystis bainbridge]MDC0715937.1 hypothetical protein [Nannocystis bainbridge]